MKEKQQRYGRDEVDSVLFVFFSFLKSFRVDVVVFIVIVIGCCKCAMNTWFKWNKAG